MKLLITGPPGSGKTTLLQDVIRFLPEPFWVVCSELRDEHGQRVGFEAETSTGLKGLLAHKHDIVSEAMVATYRVDVPAVDRLMTKPIREAQGTDRVLVIDEIGRMQMKSPAFARTMRELFAGDTDVVATIRYGDEWTAEFTSQPDVVTLTLTETNRKQVRMAIEAMLGQMSHEADGRAGRVLAMARAYAAAGQLVQLAKLYNHAIRYVRENRVQAHGDGAWTVKGDHADHAVARVGSEWRCDCDLSNGRGEYNGQAGECSHMQAAKLLSQ